MAVLTISYRIFHGRTVLFVTSECSKSILSRVSKETANVEGGFIRTSEGRQCGGYTCKSKGGDVIPGEPYEVEVAGLVYVPCIGIG